jgi:hypothetical protein
MAVVRHLVGRQTMRSTSEAKTAPMIQGMSHLPPARIDALQHDDHPDIVIGSACTHAFPARHSGVTELTVTPGPTRHWFDDPAHGLKVITTTRLWAHSHKTQEGQAAVRQQLLSFAFSIFSMICAATRATTQTREGSQRLGNPKPSIALVHVECARGTDTQPTDVRQHPKEGRYATH